MSNHQNTVLKRIFISFSLLLLAVPVQGLTPEALSTLRQSVFEVVVPKPSEASVLYKTPLPLDQLPYTERTDTFRSLGTAFLVGENDFLTAAHVIGLHGKTQWGPYYLRSTDQQTYKIDRVLAFSHAKDVVRFSVEKAPKRPALILNKAPKLDTKVYSIGNALGEGIVAREGLFTSKTPEQNNGDWQWIRFSAPASPGNSGGPLVDSKGHVMGIVLRKSPNENLNYALPVELAMSASKTTGSYYQKNYFYVPNINKKMDFETDVSVPLPMPIDAFREQLYANLVQKDAQNIRQYLEALSTSNARFPDSRKSDQVLHGLMEAPFPLLVSQEDSDHWTVDGNSYREYPLDSQDQRMYVQSKSEVYMMFLSKGKKQALQPLLEDDEVLVRYLLKTGMISRRMGAREVIVTSLGKAAHKELHTDRYGRKWLLKSWLIPFSDSTLTAAVLPVPAGLAMLVYVEKTENDYYLESSKLMLDYVIQDIYGSYDDWQAYLALSKYHPRFLKGVTITKSKRELSMATPEFSISLPAPYYHPEDEHHLGASVGYRRLDDAVTMGITGLSIGDQFGEEQMSVFEVIKPHPEASQDLQKFWQSVVKKKHPFDGKLQMTQGITQLFKVTGKSLEKTNRAEVLHAMASGKKTRSEMNRRLKKLIQRKPKHTKGVTP